MKVAVLGASQNSERFSNRAVSALLTHGHDVYPVNPALKSIHGLPVYASLGAIASAVDVLTMYVGPKLSKDLVDEILNLGPKIVVFNPGSESTEVQEALKNAGIPYIEACTLVMLRSGQFDRLLDAHDASSA
jgi:predicted CoA-binding protein